MAHEFIPGQHVTVFRGIYVHHGIVAQPIDGVPHVAELAKPRDGGLVRIIPLEEFALGAVVRIIEHEDGLSYDAVLRNARIAAHWRPYDVLSWNCEHFARWCSTGKSTSRQVTVAALALLALAVTLGIMGRQRILRAVTA